MDRGGKHQILQFPLGKPKRFQFGTAEEEDQDLCSTLLLSDHEDYLSGQKPSPKDDEAPS